VFDDVGSGHRGLVTGLEVANGDGAVGHLLLTDDERDACASAIRLFHLCLHRAPVERAVGAHVRAELAVSVLSALALAVIFRLARLPLPMLPALAAGALRLVPFFGVPLAAAFAFLAGSTIGLAAGAATATVTVLIVVAANQIVGRRLLAAPRPSQTLTVLLVVALVDAYGVIGMVFASTLAMDIEACVARLLVTHPQTVARELTLGELRARIEGTRRRVLLVPEPGATQLGGLVTRLGALAAEAEGASPPSSQLS